METGYGRGPKDVGDELVKWNVKSHSQQWVDVYNLGRETYDAVYSHRVSGRTGLLLVNEINKERDKNLPERQLKSSEVAWQSFLLGALQDGVQPWRLRCVVMQFIINENTKDVVFETTRASTSTLEKENGHKEFTDIDDGFYALLGSVLGKLAMHMLLDHKAETGYRSVDRIVLLGNDKLVAGRDWELARTFLILLSEPRRCRRAASAPPCSPERRTRPRRLSNAT